MKKVKLGFLPSHRAPFSLDWAKQMRKRCVDVFAKFEEIGIVAPDEKVSAHGLVTDEKDAKGVIDFFAEESIKGLIIGTMTFGEELPLLSDPRKLRGSWSWVEVDDLEELYDTLVYEGFTHHASMIHGDYVDSLVEFCRFAGIKPVVV
jgi:L-fucose isomerase-like protein